MVDLEQRLRALDEIALPDLWPAIEARARQAGLERPPLRLLPMPRRRPWMRLAPVAVAAIVALIATISTIGPQSRSTFAVVEQARERFTRAPFHATIRNVFGEFVGDETQVVELWFKSDTAWRSTIKSSSNPSAPSQAGDFTVFDGKRFGRYESASNTFFIQPASEIDDAYGYSGVAIHDPTTGVWPSATGIKPTPQFLNENCRVSQDEVAGRAADKLTCDTGLEGNTIREAEIWLDRETGLILKVVTSEVVREFLSIEYEPEFPAGVLDVAAPEGSGVSGGAAEGPTAAPKVDATISVGNTVRAVAVGFGAVWVVTEGGGDDRSGQWLLQRIDPAIDAVVATVPIGPYGESIAFTDDFVWVVQNERGGESSLLRVDPTTSELVGTPISLGNRSTQVAAGGGAVWVAGAAADGHAALERIDPRTNAITEIRLPGDAIGYPPPVFGGGSVWVFMSEVHQTDPNAPPKNLLYRVDARTDQVVATLRTKGTLAFGEGALWALCCHTGEERAVTLERIDPATNRVTATTELPPGASALAAGAGYVWVADADDGTIVKIAPATNRATGDALQVGRGPSAVAIGAGAVWVGNYADGTIARINIE